MAEWTTEPITITEARPHLSGLHRRRGRCHAARFAVAVALDGVIVGVAFCGNRVAPQAAGNKYHLEVLRTATNGTPNACTRLQGAVNRVARAFGYRKLFTFTDPDEGGVSLKAGGWRGPFQTKGGNWNNRKGRTAGKQPKRWRWEREL